MSIEIRHRTARIEWEVGSVIRDLSNTEIRTGNYEAKDLAGCTLAAISAAGLPLARFYEMMRAAESERSTMVDVIV